MKVSPSSFPVILLASLLAPAAWGDEVCDQFPEVHASWTLRVPRCGPTVSLDARPGFLRFNAPDGFTAGGAFDNWTGADQAPSLERYDMGDGDWTITTRVEFEVRPGTYYHVGLMVGFGPPGTNDIAYWGPYWNDPAQPDGNIALERTGTGFRPLITPDPGPISLQIQKTGTDYAFRYRSDDALPWTDGRTESGVGTRDWTIPVNKVGLMVKTYGGTAGPLVDADFDYFCLEVPGPLPADPVLDPIAILSPLSGLTCEKQGDGGVALSWSSCPGSTTPITVKIGGELVRTLDGNAVDVAIAPPIPGGSIIEVEVDNGFNSPMRCTLADTLLNICDEFDEDPLGSPDWVFRAPRMAATGPRVNIDENPGFLRFYVPPGGGAGGPFDNWTGNDSAPSLERYDMGDRDWTISTRLHWDALLGPPAVSHHVGLMVAYGSGTPVDAYNDVFYWGQYNSSTTLRLERTSSALTGLVAYNGAPVSLQIQKASNTLIFRHRQEDTDPWITDFSYDVVLPFPTNAGGSPPAGTPPTRVGLLVKTWGAGPEVTADFEYFCLSITDSPPVAVLEADPAAGVVPLDVSFTATNSVDPSGGTLTYAWDFGDGAAGTGESIGHTYTDAGIVTVRLTATDDQQNKGSAQMDLYLSDPTAPFTLDRLGTRGLNGLVLVDDSGPQRSYCVNASGFDINLSTDNAQFLNQPVNGDFRVTTKVTTGPFGSVRSRVGLMARLTTDTRSANVLMSIDNQNDGWLFQFRRANGQTTNRPTPNPNITPPRGPLPAWLQLERQGSLFVGSYSLDGTTYIEYARQDLPNLNVASLLVGLAATSGEETVIEEYCAELGGFGPTPQPPARPTGLAATGGNGQVSLDWSDNGEPDLLGYDVYRSDAGGPYGKVNGALLTASSYVDAGRANGTEYCYRVRAVNPAGESPESDTGCATPQAGGATFRRGDTDANRAIELTDAVNLLGYLFLGQSKPNCLDAADVDDNGQADISDAIANLGYQFLGGPAPLSPGPTSCGPDVNLEVPDLGCDAPCTA